MTFYDTTKQPVLAGKHAITNKGVAIACPICDIFTTAKKIPSMASAIAVSLLLFLFAKVRRNSNAFVSTTLGFYLFQVAINSRHDCTPCKSGSWTVNQTVISGISASRTASANMLS